MGVHTCQNGMKQGLQGMTILVPPPPPSGNPLPGVSMKDRVPTQCTYR